MHEDVGKKKKKAKIQKEKENKPTSSQDCCHLLHLNFSLIISIGNLLQ
jgi:hypothetical protein